MIDLPIHVYLILSIFVCIVVGFLIAYRTELLYILSFPFRKLNEHPD